MNRVLTRPRAAAPLAGHGPEGGLAAPQTSQFRSGGDDHNESSTVDNPAAKWTLNLKANGREQQSVTVPGQKVTILFRQVFAGGMQGVAEKRKLLDPLMEKPARQVTYTLYHFSDE